MDLNNHFMEIVALKNKESITIARTFNQVWQCQASLILCQHAKPLQSNDCLLLPSFNTAYCTYQEEDQIQMDNQTSTSLWLTQKFSHLQSCPCLPGLLCSLWNLQQCLKVPHCDRNYTAMHTHMQWSVHLSALLITWFSWGDRLQRRYPSDIAFLHRLFPSHSW